MSLNTTRTTLMLGIVGTSLGVAAPAQAQLTDADLIAMLAAMGFEESALKDEIKMYGVLRDFNEDHPDFGLKKSDASGHIAGNIRFFADLDHKPVFVNAGKTVQSQWYNKHGQPIAPHLGQFAFYAAWPDNAGVYMTGTMQLSQGTYVDSYDSSVGPYSATAGQDGIIAIQSGDTGVLTLDKGAELGGTLLIGPGGDTNQTVGGLTGEVDNLTAAPDPLPVLPPVNMPASIGDVYWSGNMTIDKDLHVDAVTMDKYTNVLIDGNITLLIDGKFTMNQYSTIELTPGSTLDIYTMAGADAIAQQGRINAVTQDPSLVNWFNLNAQSFNINQGTHIYASIYSPGANITLANGSEVFGRILGDSVQIDQNSAIHIDTAETVIQNPCMVTILDTQGSYAGSHSGAVTSDITYRNWFRNVPGVNAAEVYRLPMGNDGGGTFGVNFADFTPADGKMFESGMDTTNRYFTYELLAVGQYSLCANQFFEFDGAGDVWVMINDTLVIDIGGFGQQNQVVELDRMGMADGELFVFRFFYAQRAGNPHPFNIKTNIGFVFSDSDMPNSSGMYD